MKKVTICLFILIVTMSCSKEKNIYIDHDGYLVIGDYWHTSFTANESENLEIDYKKTSGGPVDILLTDRAGFEEFKNRITVDSIAANIWGLALEEFGMNEISIELGKEIRFTYCWAIDSGPPSPVDIYVMDSANFYLYENWQPFEYWIGYDSIFGIADTFTQLFSNPLHFVIDNTSAHGSVPVAPVFYAFSISQLVSQPFTYYEDGSVLYTNSVLYTYEVPESDTFYLVVNNAGYVEGGAPKLGPIDFHITIVEK